jgi:hypothetical protein
MVTTGRLESLLSKNLDLPDVVWHCLRTEADHELRVALICLLTAALAEKGSAALRRGHIIIDIQPRPDGTAKPYQVRQVLSTVSGVFQNVSAAVLGGLGKE